MIHKFHFLKLGLSAVLVFVGAKMLLTGVYKVPIGLSLGVIALVLGTSVVASLLFPKAAEEHDPVVHDPLEISPEDQIRAPIPSDGAGEGDGAGSPGPR